MIVNLSFVLIFSNIKGLPDFSTHSNGKIRFGKYIKELFHVASYSCKTVSLLNRSFEISVGNRASDIGSPCRTPNSNSLDKTQSGPIFFLTYNYGTVSARQLKVMFTQATENRKV